MMKLTNLSPKAQVAVNGFKTAAIDHSATSPKLPFRNESVAKSLFCTRLLKRKIKDLPEIQDIKLTLLWGTVHKEVTLADALKYANTQESLTPEKTDTKNPVPNRVRMSTNDERTRKNNSTFLIIRLSPLLSISTIQRKDY